MLIVLLLAVAAIQDGRSAAGSSAQPTATIRGRVTDRDSGQPLPRFRVTASKELVSDDTSAALPTAITDSNGQYELSVRPGAYVITARPPALVSTYLAGMHGDDEPLALSGSVRPRPTELKPNDRLEVNFMARRSLAIEGRVLTEDGDPLSGVLVSLERLDRPASRPAVETDDRGFYRHFGLAPGQYRLCATPAPPPPPRTPLHAAVKSPLLTACYPAGSTSTSLKPIELTRADVRNVDIVMTTARRFTVSGELQDGAGGPLDIGGVSFVEENARPRRSPLVNRVRPGRFVIRDVEPGTYRLLVDVAADPSTGRPREYAATEIVVRNEDIAGVVVRTRRPATVAGVVTFEGSAPQAGMDRMAVTIQPEHGSGTEPPAPSTFRPVRENLTFDLTAMSEPARLGLNHTPPGWIVKSILYHGRDVTDEPVVLEGSGDLRTIEIVLTNRVVYITGGAAGMARGRPVVVLTFRADKVGFAARPDVSGGSSLPVAASAPADDKGAFTVGPLLPGEYLVAAVDRDEWFDASLENRSAAIEKILPRAERLMVRDGEQPSIALPIVAVK
jgi:protocatechuate 3,4-dioxygenase beta subunit